MKTYAQKIALIVCLSLFSISVNAQYVNIPDSNFQKYLFANYPTAMLGTQLDTTHVSVLTTTSIVIDSLFIRNLDGIQYFDNLQYLQCSYNLLRSLPSLPSGLIELDCHTNQLDSLPVLPNGLQSLNCMNNNLKLLPNLTNLLKTLNCSYNQLDSLPNLPVNLVSLDCGGNQILQLPILPSALTVLNCYRNKLSSIPVLPSTLIYLNCSANPLFNLPVLPSSLSSLYCYADSLSVLPVLPTTLKTLDCSDNLISALPLLPNGLETINCRINLLTTLPTLPAALITLNCSNNDLISLPSLPSLLVQLYCNHNDLPVLPSLPLSLTYLDCSYNLSPSLPLLPASLFYLNYSANPITTLPSLPVNLSILVWNENFINILPTLPNSLRKLYCNYSDIDSLPTLPSSLSYLECRNDSLTFLPVLPALLDSIDFSNNLITTMPVLPLGLKTLRFYGNLISTVPNLPLSIKALECSGNTTLNCLPKLSSEMRWVRLDNTAINCLPNFFSVTDTVLSSLSIFSMPLCTPASACPCAWNITGNVHVDTAVNCYFDSLNPGQRVTNIKVNLYKNTVLTDNIFLTAGGEYSFDTNNNDTLDVGIDTIGLPFKVICPTTSLHNVILTPVDSMKTNINFSVECDGIDAGVNSIMGRFRPGTITHLGIKAGSMAEFYNVHCTTPYSATVTTVLDGPVQYLMPSTLALTPSAVSGNMITYNVPDMSIIDINTAFGIDVITDTSAVMGSEVCITTTVSNVIADINPSNNSIHFCIPVVNSFDPNAKLVYPQDHANAGDELTYTIHFQNTGNDTAYKVVIRDTLHSNLDPASFKFISSSHSVEYELKQNILIFYFHHINLLDSFHHEPQSHGWLQFKIKLKLNLPNGTRTPNVAAIYFDFNPPIITDTCINYVGIDPTYAAPLNPIKLPNAITPNNDGLNDSWHILNASYLNQKEISIVSVTILNRWGQKVFIASGDSWDWTPNQISSTDVFAYYITYRTRSGTMRDQRGEILVVK